jgi:hypothetical protein
MLRSIRPKRATLERGKSSGLGGRLSGEAICLVEMGDAEPLF